MVWTKVEHGGIVGGRSRVAGIRSCQTTGGLKESQQLYIAIIFYSFLLKRANIYVEFMTNTTFKQGVFSCKCWKTLKKLKKMSFFIKHMIQYTGNKNCSDQPNTNQKISRSLGS
jgi:hypothetical protein